MKSIFMRNFFVTVGVVLLSLSIFSAAFASFSYNFVISDRRDTLSATASVVAITASAKLTDSDLSDLDLRMTISSVASASGMHITLCDVSGNVRSCSDNVPLCSHLNMLIPASALNYIDLNGDYSSMTNFSGYYSSQRYVSGLAVKSPYNPATTVGYVFVAVESREVLSLWRAFTSIFFLIGLVVLFLALIASLLMTAKQVAPIREMVRVTRSFAHGEFNARAKAKRDDEMGELIESFNLMADSIEKSEMNRREFVANVSHELKTPMTTISGFADGILDGTISDGKRNEYLTIISDETKRLARLVRRMLEISRIQGIEPKTLLSSSFDITEAARKTILSLEGKIDSKNLDMDIQMPEQALIVRGEEDAVFQVLYNILDNAVKFADHDSTIVLRIWKRGEKVYVSVKNTGETIPEDDLPEIFDRFHKSDRSRSIDRDGVGLGLYIVKSIISGYGENIYVKSLNHETEFVFTLTIKQTG